MRQVIYFISLACAVLLAHAFFLPAKSDWLIITAILLAFVLPNVNAWHKIKIILFVGVVSALGVLFAAALTFYPAMFYLTASTILLVYIGQQAAEYYYPTFIINFLILLAACMPVTMAAGLYRAEFVLAGTSIVMILQIIYLPYFWRTPVLSWLVHAVRALAEVNNEMFACLLQPDYAESIYLFERRLHARKNAFIQDMIRVHAVDKDHYIAKEKREWLHMSVTKVEALFSILLECSMVRWRVTDHSLFSLCRKELLAVYSELCKMFPALVAVLRNQQAVIDVKPLIEKIQALEENYQHVLQVAAQEPLAMLLFIDGLKGFCEKVSDIRGWHADS